MPPPSPGPALRMDLTQPQPSLRSCSQDKLGSPGTELVQRGAQTNSKEMDHVASTPAAGAQEQGGLSLQPAGSCSSPGQESRCSCIEERGRCHWQRLKDSRAVKHKVSLSVHGDPTAPHGQTHSTPMPSVAAGPDPRWEDRALGMGVWRSLAEGSYQKKGLLLQLEFYSIV